MKRGVVTFFVHFLCSALPVWEKSAEVEVVEITGFNIVFSIALQFELYMAEISTLQIAPANVEIDASAVAEGNIDLLLFDTIEL